MTISEQRPADSRRIAAFCLVQMAVISAGVCWAAYRHHSMEQSRRLPVPQTEPLHVSPLYDNADVISDAQLVKVLNKLKPRMGRVQPNINHVDHALRFWGVAAEFNDPECLSGFEMRDILLDHRQFSRAWGDETRPFLIEEHDGLRVRTREGISSSSHVDHTLASLAETGTPLDYPIITANGETTLQQVFDQALRDFSLNQLEYEWSTLAFALYVPPTRSWISTEGQEITFDRLAQRIMRQRLAQGVCRGNHRLHTLVMLLRIDDQVDILSPDGRTQIVDYLKDVTHRLVEHQHTEGYWEGDWPGPERDGPQLHNAKDNHGLVNRLLVTGHAMEWWSLAPAEVQPPRETLVSAGQWLSRTINGLSTGQIRAYYTYLTHAGRAMSLWRGMEPAEAIRRFPGLSSPNSDPTERSVRQES